MPYAPPPPMGWGPGYAAPPPPKPLGSLAIATNILMGIAAAVSAYSAYAFFHRASVFADIQDGDFSGIMNAGDADDPVKAALGLGALSMLAVAVLYIIWSYRARTNIEAWQGPRPKLSKGWAIGGWFIPLANFVLPGMVANDIVNGSDTRAAHPGGRAGGKGLLWAWWGMWVASFVLFTVGVSIRDSESDLDNGDVTFDAYVSNAKTADSLAGTASVLRLVAAVLAILVVHRISRMQAQRIAMGPGAYPPGPGMGMGMGMGTMPGAPGMPGYPGAPGAPGMPGYPGMPGGGPVPPQGPQAYYQQPPA
jgi:hypothetical protein